MYFNICPLCGCHLDPGERCDCRKEGHAAKKAEEYIKRLPEQNAAKRRKVAAG